MRLLGIKKFSFTTLVKKDYISNLFKKNSHSRLLGRWNLKHKESELNTFYRYIPDPGYPNIYPDSIVSGYEPQYNRSGKMQK
tara:strand:+ start:1067 stop:1312 length:246 start_codon:yes stop_codon:yes gene_type:complete